MNVVEEPCQVVTKDDEAIYDEYWQRKELEKKKVPKMSVMVRFLALNICGNYSKSSIKLPRGLIYLKPI